MQELYPALGFLLGIGTGFVGIFLICLYDWLTERRRRALWKRKKDERIGKV